MNAGHYIHNKLDYDEMNVNVQCVRCNKWLSGNLGKYAEKLIEKHGMEKIQELRQRASLVVYEKYSLGELESIYSKYRDLLFHITE